MRISWNDPPMDGEKVVFGMQLPRSARVQSLRLLASTSYFIIIIFFLVITGCKSHATVLIRHVWQLCGSKDCERRMLRDYGLYVTFWCLFIPLWVNHVTSLRAILSLRYFTRRTCLLSRIGQGESNAIVRKRFAIQICPPLKIHLALHLTLLSKKGFLLVSSSTTRDTNSVTIHKNAKFL